ncbi:MAG: Fic family protein [Legionella sp.]|uniref:hypothetical protein n=1 Tax=Legionella sp. TaxID=459 RepID=UPI00284EE806|nr:Fic family protein [Legionella sp.]
MKISAAIQARLDKLDESKSILKVIVIGIRTGQITGEEAELREFIRAHSTDPTEIECINDPSSEYSSTLISELFSGDLSTRTEEAKNNILIAFRVFFEKNPLAIAKSTLRHVDGEERWSESAAQRICSSPEFQNKLMPELSRFIDVYAPDLQEVELRRLVSAFHESSTLRQMIIDAFISGNFNAPHCARNVIADKDLQPHIANHYHPAHKNDNEFFYRDFPTLELWRLFMDGNQQYDGWLRYEAREKGCINKLYQGWLYVRQTTYEPLTPAYFKNIHAICAQGIVLGDMHGQFREYRPSFGLSTDSMTFLGYIEHIRHLNDLCSLQAQPLSSGFDAISRIETPELERTIKSIIQEYESKILNDSENPQAVLQAIIILCKKLVLIHPFNDCNGRVFSNLILNRELIRNGFSPTLLDNPNRMDGYSINEFMSELLRGMDNFQRLKNEGLYKDTPTTIELLKTQTYPIPEIWSLAAPSKAKSGSEVALNQYAFFVEADGIPTKSERHTPGPYHLNKNQ